MATPQYKGQLTSRIKGQTTCMYHKDRKLDIYCEECQELACTKFLSTVHKKHPLCDLSEITPKMNQEIQNFIDKTENVDLVQIDQYITATDTHLKDNTSHFEKLSQQLKKQTKKINQDLNQLSAQTLSLYQQMEEDNTKLLQTYKQDLEMYSTQLKQQVQECKKALQGGSDIHIYDTGRDIQSPVTLHVKPTLGTASFNPNRNPKGHLEQALGKVDTSSKGRGQTSFRSDQSCSGHELPPTQKSSERTVRRPSTQQSSRKRNEVIDPVYTLLPQTTVLGEWVSPYYMTSVCPTTDGQVWTSAFFTGTINLLDRKGNVIQEVTHNADITDIGMSPTTNTLWICDKNNNITELGSGRLVLRFSTREKPQCICITASNHVIVGTDKHISKFTTNGKLVLTSSASRTGKPLVCTPYRVSECPVTHNVAVADSDSEDDGGKGKPRVIVMDTDFKELFEYDGKVPDTYQPTSQSGGQPFNPCGAVYDTVGNLVIGDFNNKSVLLISGRCEFLRIIYTHDYCTYAVEVDKNGVLWAAFGGYYVQRLQYLH
ncbi:uncharacterized protein LOC110453553 [Mizuhopecten yessoensis]|uniref:uncharacterized protein LOC110453553 n=1 Tax=Mizuhopecten yessoensis TaxID=6573 RepID=UPI000B45E5D2|nr:uncharacterized protein LOC110453553 [Mizuhopecten yessoensis]